MDGEPKNELILPASIILGSVIISASILYAAGAGLRQTPSNSGSANSTGSAAPSVDIQTALALTSRDVVLGNASAPVTVIEYADYQCPFCEEFFKIVEPKIKSDYIDAGKVKFVYRNFPFLDSPQFSPPDPIQESHLAAEAAECAKDQNQFWPYHDQLFVDEGRDGKERNGNLNRSLFLQTASQLGMNAQAFTKCYDSHKYASTILADAQSAAAIGVQGTPTVFVNGVKLSGVDPSDPYGQYKTAIDNALKAK